LVGWADGRRDNKKEGFGEYYYTNGSRYLGEWRSNRKHGKGILSNEDGTNYKGEWVEGLQQGKFLYQTADGVERVEMYEKGKRLQRGPSRQEKERSQNPQGTYRTKEETKWLLEFKDEYKAFLQDSGNSEEIQDWTLVQVLKLLAHLNLEVYCNAFMVNEVNGDKLMKMKEGDFKDIGVLLKGHRMTLRDKLQDIIKVTPFLKVDHMLRSKLEYAGIIDQKVSRYYSLVPMRIEEVEEEFSSPSRASNFSTKRIDIGINNPLSKVVHAIEDNTGPKKLVEVAVRTKERSYSENDIQIIKETIAVNALDDSLPSKVLNNRRGERRFQFDISNLKPICEDSQDLTSQQAQPSSVKVRMP
jgi:hypothetical protein